MKNTMVIDSSLIGTTFTVPSTPGAGPLPEWKTVGWAQNDTFCILGALNDTPNNRFEVKSFKLTEVKFKGQVISTTPGIKVI